MNRLWEIREKDGSRYGHRMGMKFSSMEEAYDCGYEEGYEAAMEEMEHYGSRMSSRSGRRMY